MAHARSRDPVVDPHADIADLTCRTTTLDASEVETASSPHRAIAQLKRHAFSVALVNLPLPDADGLPLLRLLKSRDPSMEVILMTGCLPSNVTVVEAGEQG